MGRFFWGHHFVIDALQPQKSLIPRIILTEACENIPKTKERREITFQIQHYNKIHAGQTKPYVNVSLEKQRQTQRTTCSRAH